MDDSGTGAVAQPRSRMRGHWVVFLVLVVAAYLVTAAFHGNWTYAAGLVAVPAAVGFFIVRGGRDIRGLAARYAAFVAVLCLLVVGGAVRAVETTGAEVRAGCLENNAAVAQLEREEDKQTFCGCLGDRLAWPVARVSGAAFLTFGKPTPIQDDSEMTAVVTEAFSQCAALLPTS